MKAFIQNLELIGMKPREIRVLTTLHIFGALSVTKLAGRAKLPRTTTEAILRRLNERGYVRRVLHGKRHLWKATHVQKVKSKTDTAFDAIQKEIDPGFVGPVLESIDAKDVNIRVFRGKKQMLEAYHTFLPTNGHMRGIQGAGFAKHFITHVFDPELQTAYHRAAIQKSVVAEGIVAEAVIRAYFEVHLEASFWEQAFAVAYRMHTVPDALVPFDCEIVISDDRAIISNPKEKLMVVIQHRAFVPIFEAHFSLLRTLATPVDTFELKRRLLERSGE